MCINMHSVNHLRSTAEADIYTLPYCLLLAVQPISSKENTWKSWIGRFENASQYGVREHFTYTI